MANQQVQVPPRFTEIQKELDATVNEMKKIETEFTKVAQGKQSLAEKKKENEMVLEEFGMMSEGAAVYKLVGPVLAKQELQESKMNVSKRLEYIDNEIKRLERLEQDFQGKVEEKQRNIMRLQDEYRKLMVSLQSQAQQQQQKQQ